MNLKDDINIEKLPSHVAIIMDGNGRWARKKGNIRIFGHRNAVNAVRETVEAAGELGIKYLTLFAFSTENWDRPKDEIDALMGLILQTIQTELKKIHENNVKFNVIGNFESLPENVKKEIDNAIDFTRNNTGLNLIIALSYSGRWDILSAVRQIGKDIANGKADPEKINYDTINSYLSTRQIPDPELLIRTSGEYRISNFLLWQAAYTELYFTDTLWPDFGKKDFYKAILDYQKRDRRFGKVSSNDFYNESANLVK